MGADVGVLQVERVEASWSEGVAQCAAPQGLVRPGILAKPWWPDWPRLYPVPSSNPCLEPRE